MRVSVVFTAVSMMAAAPVWGQSITVLSPRTTLAAHVMCADLLVPALPVPVSRIKGAQNRDPRLALARGDVIVVGRAPDDGLAVGQRYFVRRMPSGQQAYLPKSGGFVPVRTPGWVTITAMDEVNAMATIDYACDDVEPDDYLVPFTELVLPSVEAAMPPPDFSERVQVLTGLEGRELMGDGDSFSIARGSEHGVTVGARFAIYRDRKDGKPLVHIGEAIVTEPSPTSSKVLLMRTIDVVSPSDVAVPRRAGAQD
jgi:hypothetical protein